MDMDIMSDALGNELYLSEDNIGFIKKGYKKFSRVPTETELDVCGEVLKERRGLSEGYCFSSVTSESRAIAETYKDLSSKARAVYGGDFFPASAYDCALVLEDYMRGIGRADDSIRRVDKGEGFGRAILDGTQNAVFTFDKPIKKKRIWRKSGVPYNNMALVYIYAQDEARIAVDQLFADQSFKKLRKIIVRIGEYGIIGAICRCTFIRGVKADVSRLPSGGADARTLVNGYRGGYILITPKTNLASLNLMAERNGIKAVYFAYLTKSGLIEGNSNAPFVLPVSTLRKLISSSKEMKVTVRPKEDAVCGASTDVIVSGGYLTASSEINSKSGFFGVTDQISYLILSLVSKGVDRRAVALAFDYRLKRRTEDPDAEMDDILALCLGAYRVGVEIATPVGITDMRYSYGESSLFCTAYGAIPRQTVENIHGDCEGNLYFMPIARGADGLVNFSKLRRVCDDFTSICGKGRVLRSTAVSRGGLGEAIDKIAPEGTVLLEEGEEKRLSDDRLGILFVAKSSNRGELLGSIEKTQTDS